MAKADILIVEDHPTMREAMRLVLEHEGFVIREAADGTTALAMVREQPPDLMFLDLNIPGVGGADVLSEVKADPSTRDVRIIIVTATGEEGRDYVLSLGADEYFTKPFSPTTLLRTVERVLALEPGS
ncbi:MAG TPA: response regulator [Actinomycetota bacterium]|jgi:CheY-like chemotaxis protein|nr:response regulator [Actinomycetota bacterium]